MNKEAIDVIIEKNPKLASSRHAFEKMQKGAYCLHRSWGFGEIKNYDAANNKLIIDFVDGKDQHPMDPAFCVDKLEILDADNLLVRQHTEPEAVAQMVKNDPVEVVIDIISRNPNGTASATEIETFLTRLLGKAKFKKWWTNAKKLLVKDPRIAVPVKKADPYVLRDEPLTPEEEILEEFYANKKPKKKILLAERLYQLSDCVEVIANDLPRILEELTGAIQEAKTLTQAERLHGLWVRNDLCRHLCEDVESLEPTSTSLILETKNLSELAEELPSNYYKRFLDLLSRVYPSNWHEFALSLLRESNGKFTSECVSFLIERDYGDLIEESFNKWLNERTFRGPVLYWVVKNRNTKRFHRLVKDILNHRLLSAILYAIESEALQLTSNRRILLADFLSEDSNLISELLSDATAETARDLAHRLMINSGFEELTKRSLLARFIKQFPTLQSLVAGEAEQEAEQLIVSQESLDERKKEYEILISQKIPENKEAIATAREHGDLRENAEYKMARQDQEILLARKSLLEVELGRARVTDFSEATNDAVSIGSIVILEEGSSNKRHTFSILGAWDSRPEDHILSYKTPLGQSLLTKKVGDHVTVDIDGHEENWNIKEISRWVDRKKK